MVGGYAGMGFAFSYPHPPYPLGRDFLPFTYPWVKLFYHTITLMDWDQVTCSHHVTLHHSAQDLHPHFIQRPACSRVLDGNNRFVVAIASLNGGLQFEEERTVIGDPLTKTVSCSCRMFNRT